MATSQESAEVNAGTHAMTDEELLTMVQEAVLPDTTGMRRIRSPAWRLISPGDENLVALGASGFGIMALVVGVEEDSLPASRASNECRGSFDFLQRQTDSTVYGLISSTEEPEVGQPLFLENMTMAAI